MMRGEDFRTEYLRTEYYNLLVLEEAYADSKKACLGLKDHLDTLKRKIRKFYKSKQRKKEFDWHYSISGEVRWCKEWLEHCTPEELAKLNQSYDLECSNNYGQFETNCTRAFNVAGKCVYYIFQTRIS